MQYTCDGEDVSPPLQWSGVPPEAARLALIVDDPDAPAGTWVHWVLFDMPADLRELPEGGEAGVQGQTSFGQVGYGGPCPPGGSEHRYFFRLYALDQALGLPEGASRAEVDAAMEGHILAQAELMGLYGR